jgi:hypothetical protein
MKKTKIVVFISGNGTTTARATARYQPSSRWLYELATLTQKGFFPLASFIIPARYPRNYGWSRVYNYFIRHATRFYGI